MTPFTELDVFACPLDGTHLIEASAGTGKTWNICALYLRLLLEQGRTVEQILVVTFTNAATAELRDRIRGRIVETLNDLATRHPDSAAADPFIRKLRDRLEHTPGLNRELLIRRLHLARETFDEAAIFTIHGFCQRALAETPFSAGMPFDLELVQDDGRLIQQAVNDFWRRHIAYAGFQTRESQRAPGQTIEFTPILASHLIQKKDDPGKYARLLRRILGKPLSRTLWPETGGDTPTLDGSAVQHAYDEAQMIWQGQASAIEALLLKALDQLNRTSYKAEAISNGALDWNRWFESGQSFAAFPGADSKVHLYRSSKLQGAQKKNCVAPSHAFFDAADELCAAVDELQHALTAARMQLLRTLVQTVPSELRQTKRQHRFIAFDDMLFNLYHALNSGEFAFLARRLRAQYPVAMIDEFQDTDPLQFEIFKTLYRPEERPGPTLFMVGDPKQAIYSFRNADLHTYLRAQSLATEHHTLAANQRSDAGLIRACNSLFGRNHRAFLLPGIEYRPVEKGQRSIPRFRDDSIARRSPLQAWLLPRNETGEWPSRDEGFKCSAEATAGEIARLLREGRNGLVTIDGRSLAAGDIAVLVRSHAQGRRMRRALAALSVGCVELSLASVFRSEEAEEIERILLAILEPGRERLLRAALATELLGYDAAGLDALLQREDDFFDCMQRFAEYRQLWEQRGFAMMFRKLLRVEQVQTRLLQLDRPERRLTNVLHLAELLAAADPEQLSPDSLLRWLRTQRAESDAGDAAQLRLESDRNLVQIVTVHKSKGLEYPIVFCPFLWDGYRNSRSGTPDVVEYHDADGIPTLDFRPDARKDPTVEPRLQDEAAAETLRLIYVALTRAVHRCYLIAGCYTSKTFGRVGHTESTRSMLNWLVAGNDFSPDAWFKEKIEPERIDAAWRELAEACPEDFAIAALPDFSQVPNFEAPETPSVLAARPAPGPILESWNRSSFSGMIRTLARVAAESDHDTDEGVVSAARSEPAGVPAIDDILAFPRGAAAGECLHHLFEHVDFSCPTDWEAAIDEALATHPQGIGTAPPTSFRPMLLRMLSDALSTELQPGLRLQTVTRDHRLSELPFTLPARHVQPSQLNPLLENLGYRVGRLDFPDLNGYLSGAIDLVFRHEGRYFLLDWKSNHLGDTRDDYAPARLDQAMTQHAYRLQYLIYTVALHRHLQRRCPDYRYDRDFGGVFYLFIRGVRPEWVDPQGPAGVYFDRPSAETISMLDELFGGAHKAAA